MALSFLLTLQAAAAPVSAPAAAPPFDLAKVGSAAGEADRCRRPSGEIVVCGRPTPDYPLEQWEKVFATSPVVAETPILGGKATARAYVESVGVGGFVSKRAMIGIKLPF